ncbi:2-amino-4-hydroxy-6-hydroxymethyldihydropteridine diphosphokinase [Isoptericola croceus]|uniref:2-amino-4-hydroxy-6- hydroxymethyldihydropteridine diphosphokinase n=1 Tax=Isoptericola croceus TaxID=3031406 RepID=UPI0023F933AD|nr:2-amino-4-hydroxy-6-hydroxymethyldihydropteridine diphosphokinase [Isoptericola croceus]
MTFADAVPGPDGRPLDQIRLTGVTATGHHGVLPEERAEGQTFRADVVLHLDTQAAARSDDLTATVSYAEVAEDVYDVLSGPPVDLVETVAERIASVLLSYASVQAVDVRVHKPQAPISVPFDDVEVVVRRDRERLPAVSPEPEPEQWHEAVAPETRPAPITPADAVSVPSAPVPSAPVPSTPVPSAPVPAASVPSAPSAPVPSEPVPAAPVPTAAAPDSGATMISAVPVGLAASPAATEPGRVPEPEPEPTPAPPLDPLDTPPSGPVDAVLALGSNLGDPQGTLRAAVTDIDRIAGLQVMEVSPLARTAAVGPEQPDFLNAVLLVRTTLPPRDLLGACQEVELLHGRVRDERWGPRTLDIDLVQYDGLVTSADDLELPHPRARERAFVLVPWAEVDPDAVLGGLGGGPVAQLAATAPDRPGIRWLALDWLTEPATTGAVAAQPQAAEQPAPGPWEQPGSQPVAAPPVNGPPPSVQGDPVAPDALSPAREQLPPSIPVPRQEPPQSLAPQGQPPQGQLPQDLRQQSFEPEPEPEVIDGPSHPGSGWTYEPEVPAERQEPPAFIPAAPEPEPERAPVQQVYVEPWPSYGPDTLQHDNGTPPPAVYGTQPQPVFAEPERVVPPAPVHPPAPAVRPPSAEQATIPAPHQHAPIPPAPIPPAPDTGQPGLR